MFLAGAAAIAIDEAEEAEERRVRIRQIRIRRQELRDTSNPFALDAEYFRKLYRMHPNLVLDLVDLLRPHMELHNDSTIPLNIQVLCALRFFAEGGYQKGVGQDHHHPVSQSTVSRCLNRVTNALVALAPRFIRLPSTREERQQVAQRFRRHTRIPRVLGIIDCVRVGSIRPCENEEAFYNYKGYHALNVQVISDADFVIRNIRCCPGSSNDRFVWAFSEAKQFFQRLRQDERITRDEGRYYLLDVVRDKHDITKENILSVTSRWLSGCVDRDGERVRSAGPSVRAMPIVPPVPTAQVAQGIPTGPVDEAPPVEPVVQQPEPQLNQI